LPQDAAATAEDPAMAFIMRGWPLLAAEAWEGYRRRGRGLLLLNSCRHYDYRTRTPCEWDSEKLPDYDPERQIVVAFYHEGDLEGIYVLEGWPAPPVAALITPAEAWRLVEEGITAH
jgi:hypothetical protein